MALGAEVKDFISAYQTFHGLVKSPAQREREKLELQMLRDRAKDYPDYLDYLRRKRKFDIDNMDEQDQFKGDFDKGTGGSGPTPDTDLPEPGSETEPDTGGGSKVGGGAGETKVASMASYTPDSAETEEADTSARVRGYVWPATGTITGVYGDARGSKGRFHSGFDTHGRNGDPVRAPYSGTVMVVGFDPGSVSKTGKRQSWGYQHYVVIKGDDGYYYRVAGHGDTSFVHEGQRVAAGDRIGTVGLNHVHTEIIPPTSPAAKAWGRGEKRVSTQTWNIKSSPTVDPHKIWGITYGQKIVGGQPIAYFPGGKGDAAAMAEEGGGGASAAVNAMATGRGIPTKKSQKMVAYGSGGGDQIEEPPPPTPYSTDPSGDETEDPTTDKESLLASLKTDAATLSPSGSNRSTMMTSGGFPEPDFYPSDERTPRGVSQPQAEPPPDPDEPLIVGNQEVWRRGDLLKDTNIRPSNVEGSDPNIRPSNVPGSATEPRPSMVQDFPDPKIRPSNVPGSATEPRPSMVPGSATEPRPSMVPSPDRGVPAETVVAGIPTPRPKPYRGPLPRPRPDTGGFRPSTVRDQPQPAPVAAAPPRGSKGLKRLSGEDRQALVDVARQFGVAPADLLAVIGYETIGTYNPSITSPSGRIGLIQFGKNERKKYGFKPGMTFAEQLRGPVAAYLRDRGLEPGMGLASIYSIVLAGSLDKNGRPRWGRSDSNGSLRYHVNMIAKNYRPAALAYLGGNDVSAPVVDSGIKMPDTAGARMRPSQPRVAMATGGVVPTNDDIARATGRTGQPAPELPQDPVIEQRTERDYYGRPPDPETSPDEPDEDLDDPHLAIRKGSEYVLGVDASDRQAGTASPDDLSGADSGYYPDDAGATPSPARARAAPTATADAGDGGDGGDAADAGDGGDGAIPTYDSDSDGAMRLTGGREKLDPNMVPWLRRAIRNVDPKGELPEGYRTMLAAQRTYKFFMNHGDPVAAQRSAAAFVLYMNTAYNGWREVAQAALENGELTDAMKAAIKAVENIPDGYKMHVQAINRADPTAKPDPHNPLNNIYKITYTDVETGKEVQSRIHSPQEVAALIWGLSPKTFYRGVSEASGGEMASDEYYKAIEELNANDGRISSKTRAAVTDPGEIRALLSAENAYVTVANKKATGVKAAVDAETAARNLDKTAETDAAAKTAIAEADGYMRNGEQVPPDTLRDIPTDKRKPYEDYNASNVKIGDTKRDEAAKSVTAAEVEEQFNRAVTSYRDNGFVTAEDQPSNPDARAKFDGWLKTNADIHTRDIAENDRNKGVDYTPTTDDVENLDKAFSNMAGMHYDPETGDSLPAGMVAKDVTRSIAQKKSAALAVMKMNGGMLTPDSAAAFVYEMTTVPTGYGKSQTSSGFPFVYRPDPKNSNNAYVTVPSMHREVRIPVSELQVLMDLREQSRVSEVGREDTAIGVTEQKAIDARDAARADRAGQRAEESGAYRGLPPPARYQLPGSPPGSVGR